MKYLSILRSKVVTASPLQPTQVDTTPLSCTPQIDGLKDDDIYGSTFYLAANEPTLNEKQSNP